MKYKIKYEGYNVWVLRDFQQYHTILRRAMARIKGWEKAVKRAKKDILKEAQERYRLKKQKTHKS